MTPQHVYEVTEISGDFPNVEVGSHFVAGWHVRKHHEPYRSWDFVNLDTGEPTGYIVGKHIGEYEKVKHLLVKGEAS